MTSGTKTGLRVSGLNEAIADIDSMIRDLPQTKKQNGKCHFCGVEFISGDIIELWTSKKLLP